MATYLLWEGGVVVPKNSIIATTGYTDTINKNTSIASSMYHVYQITISSFWYFQLPNWILMKLKSIFKEPIFIYQYLIPLQT